MQRQNPAAKTGTLHTESVAFFREFINSLMFVVHHGNHLVLIRLGMYIPSIFLQTERHEFAGALGICGNIFASMIRTKILFQKINKYKKTNSRENGYMQETNRTQIFIALIIATFLTAIEGTIVSTAMPKIVNDLGGGHLYTWVISIYLLATVLSTPVFGKMADLYGRKRMFTIGVLIFLSGSMLSGFSQSMEQLVVFRLVQGIGAGALATIPFIIIGDVFTFEERGRIQGWISSVWGISGIIGPVTGGLIVDLISWHWIFFMNLPFGLVSLFLLRLSLCEKLERKKQVIDYGGIITFSLAMTSFLFATALLKEEGTVSTGAAAWLGASVILLAIFLLVEAKSREPMLPLSLFKIPVLFIVNVTGFLLSIILITATFYIPLWVQGVTNLNATYSGIAALPISVTWLFGAILAGKKIAKAPLGRIVAAGNFFIFAGAVGLSLFKADTGIPWMMAVSALLGFGFGISFTTFTVAVQSAVGWNRRGAAMGAHNLMKNLGQVIGISFSGLLLSEELKGMALQTSLHTIFVILVILSIAAMALSYFLFGKRGENLVAH